MKSFSTEMYLEISFVHVDLRSLFPNMEHICVLHLSLCLNHNLRDEILSVLKRSDGKYKQNINL